VALPHEWGARAHTRSTAGRFHQCAEDCPRGLIIFYRTFGVPLHSQDKMIWRCTLNRFDDSILFAPGHNAKLVADPFR
jgi:hypothetical protein